MSRHMLNWFCGLMLLLTCCSIKDNTVNEFVQKFESLDHNLTFERFDHVILLPGEGCLGCISKTEKFIKTVSSSDRIFVVFTNIKSKKILKLKVGVDLDQSFFHLDEQNGFNSGKLYSMYPTVFFIKDGEVKGFEYISPSTKFQLEDIKLN